MTGRRRPTRSLLGGPMNPRDGKRKRLFVDSQVQGALALRAVLYWGASIATMGLMLLCFRIIAGPARLFYEHFDEMWFHYGPALAGSILILPLLVIDVVRLSNRFAGPLVRLRRGMRALARGEHVEPLHFREGDFWQEFADEFNAVAARLERLQAAAPATSACHPSEEAEPAGAVG